MRSRKSSYLKNPFSTRCCGVTNGNVLTLSSLLSFPSPRAWMR
ncbi:MAG: hypothetical protein MjAS7_1653 [Metallosphaera javensis (ex Sakai et al. 2022)]|nr:MAG: hypothetical protein MjAS7_1653 [Metallosphaera javensis (ex Sakai et al. 2022)]